MDTRRIRIPGVFVGPQCATSAWSFGGGAWWTQGGLGSLECLLVHSAPLALSPTVEERGGHRED